MREIRGATNYRCELENNWRVFVGVHEGLIDLIEAETVNAIKESERYGTVREARGTWASVKFYAAQKRHAGFLLSRE